MTDEMTRPKAMLPENLLYALQKAGTDYCEDLRKLSSLLRTMCNIEAEAAGVEMADDKPFAHPADNFKIPRHFVRAAAFASLGAEIVETQLDIVQQWNVSLVEYIALLNAAFDSSQFLAMPFDPRPVWQRELRESAGELLVMTSCSATVFYTANRCLFLAARAIQIWEWKHEKRYPFNHLFRPPQHEEWDNLMLEYWRLQKLDATPAGRKPSSRSACWREQEQDSPPATAPRSPAK